MSSELAIRTELNFVLFLGKTCKVAILTEVLLLDMNVVELMRKCVALCRLQQLPDTSASKSIVNGGKRDNKPQRQLDER